jgi:hypothetical protein
MAHKDAVRKDDHIHMPGLALAVSKLTVAHTQMLLAVPMEALRPTPAATVNAEYSTYLPEGTIGNEYLNRFIIIAFVPKYHNTKPVIDALDTDGFSKIPLLLFLDVHRFAVIGRNTFGQIDSFYYLSGENHSAVEFQICNISPAFGMDMVEIVSMSKPAVKSKIAGNVFLDNPVDKLSEKNIMILELHLLLEALLLFDKTPEFERIMLSAGANIICYYVVMGDLEPLLGMIPERTDILDKLAAVVNKNIIKRNYTLLAVASRGFFLKPVKTFCIEFLDVPICGGKPAIQTGLVGCNSKLAVETFLWSATKRPVRYSAKWIRSGSFANR